MSHFQVFQLSETLSDFPDTMNHKISFPREFTALMALTALVSGLFFGGTTQTQAQATELGAMILTPEGQRQRGFVQNSNENGLLFSLVEGAPGTGYRWEDQVVAVAFDDADEIMREARAAFAQGDFESAAAQFGQIADTYVIAAWVPSNFAAEARYLQIEALRRLGQWESLAPLLETPTAQAIPKVLSEFYQPQFKLNQIWASLGAGQMDPVRAEVESRQIPQTGQAKLLPSPAFQPMPMRELIQIAFLRAKLNEAAGEPAKALEDYYRTFSLTYANDDSLSKQAMNAAMAIQAGNPDIQGEEPKNPAALRRMQSVAYLYKLAFGGGNIDSQFSAYAVQPELPKPPPAQEPGAEEAAPAAEGEMKEGEAEAAPADSAGDSDEKSKEGGKKKKE